MRPTVVVRKDVVNGIVMDRNDKGDNTPHDRERAVVRFPRGCSVDHNVLKSSVLSHSVDS